MSDRDLFDGATATAEELEAASRLADALGGGESAGAEIEPLAVARLLEAASPIGAGDDLAARRLRIELTALAARRSRVRAARSIVPIAAAVAGVVFLSVLLWRLPAAPSERTLAARQQAARAAVVAVASMWNGEEAATSRLAAVSEQQWRSRLTTMIDRGRFEQLATESARDDGDDRRQPLSRATLATPTPGGTS